MKLVWVVIPLIFLGITGLQDSFAESQVTISGNGVQLLESQIENTMLVITIDTQNDAHIDVTVPNDVWFISGLDCQPVRPFLLIDGEETDFEISYTETTSNYTFSIPAGSEQIEFAYTFLLDQSPTVYEMGKECWTVEKIKFMPPLKQVKNDVSSFDIVCKKTFELIFKSSDNFPACVKPSTAEKLIERGWLAKPSFWIEYQIVQHGNEWDYKISQWVKDNPNVKYTSEIGLQLIKDHFIEKGIKVLDIKFALDETLSNRLICEADSCPSGQKIMLKIDDPDSPLLNNMYWKKSSQ